MIEKPSAETAESFQDLVDQGIAIEIDVRSNTNMPKHRILGPLIVHNPLSYSKLNRTRAYLLERQLAETLMALSVNYNFDRQRPNYAILRETLGTRLAIYWMPYRSPFVELFRSSQTRLFEAGILNKWKNVLGSAWVADIVDCDQTVQCGTGTTLKFADFVPLWVMYGIGLTVSGVILFVEVVIQWNR